MRFKVSRKTFGKLDFSEGQVGMDAHFKIEKPAHGRVGLFYLCDCLSCKSQSLASLFGWDQIFRSWLIIQNALEVSVTELKEKRLS